MMILMMYLKVEVYRETTRILGYATTTYKYKIYIHTLYRAETTPPTPPLPPPLYVCLFLICV